VQVVLSLDAEAYRQLVSHCLRSAPLEACGLLVGRPLGEDAHVDVARAATNAAASSRVYTVAPRDLLAADREAEDAGAVLVGVYHSHTHTEAYPSPTDVAAAPDPGWHYVIVSLRDTEPTLRSYRIVGGNIEEEPVVLQ